MSSDAVFQKQSFVMKNVELFYQGCLFSLVLLFVLFTSWYSGGKLITLLNNYVRKIRFVLHTGDIVATFYFLLVSGSCETCAAFKNSF